MAKSNINTGPDKGKDVAPSAHPTVAEDAHNPPLSAPAPIIQSASSFGQRLASSASSLGRAAFTTNSTAVNATLAAQLQAGDKASTANGTGVGSSAAAAAEGAAASGRQADGRLRAMNGQSDTFRTQQSLDTDMGLEALSGQAAFPQEVELDREAMARPNRPPHEGMPVRRNPSSSNAFPEQLSQEGELHGQRDILVSNTSHLSAQDGAEVAALLNIPGSLSTVEDLEAETAMMPGIDANELFASAHSHLDHSHEQLEAQLRSSLPPPPAHNGVSAQNSINLKPIGFEDDEEGFLASWRDVLDRYTDDVWDPQSQPWITEARQELKNLQDGPNSNAGKEDDEQRATAVKRLRQILRHVQLPSG